MTQQVIAINKERLGFGLGWVWVWGGGGGGVNIYEIYKTKELFT